MPRPLLRPPLLEQEPPSSGQTAPEALRVVLPLRTITPVIGGGVEPYEPDEVDVVRVPSIRGMLRWWWRLLYGWSEKSAESLFQHEAKLWGGVSVDPAGKGTGALKSRVRVKVEMTSGGTAVPAGVHRVNPTTGRLKALPEWSGDDRLGYALFPFQRTQPERDARRPVSDFPTRRIRGGSAFQLDARLAPGPEGELAESHARELLSTLWFWIHLGGLGARTRRGFGALELSAPPELFGWATPESQAWARLFDPTDRRTFAERFAAVLELGGLVQARWARCLLVSNPQASAEAAHAHAVGLLKRFRQGENLGRDPRAGGNTPGRSRWPEPNLVRLLAHPAAPPGFWDHPPPPGLAERVRDMGAPRAAFGLPIQIKFKRSTNPAGGDPNANATLLPPGGDRWASPLLLRPIRWQAGEYRALAIVLAGQPPEAVEVSFESYPARNCEVPVPRSEGSRGDIARLLTRTSGDALEALGLWLQEPGQGFAPLLRATNQGGSHA